MEKMLLFLCLFGVAPFAKGAWVPEAESLDPQNPKCIDILQVRVLFFSIFCKPSFDSKTNNYTAETGLAVLNSDC